MLAKLSISGDQLAFFLLTVSRMSGLMIFLPVPGLRAIPESIRPLIALALAIGVSGGVEAAPQMASSPSALVVCCLAELSFGLLWGLAVHYLIEAFVLGAQFLALQAGFGYASIIDPATQADAGLLQMLAQLMASLLFFVSGLHREVLYLLAESLHRIPPGHFILSAATGNSLIALGADMLEIAARLAMPLLALLILVDLALALIGRIQAQLQLLPMAFPAKLLVSLLVLGMLTGSWVNIFGSFRSDVVGFLARIVAGGG